MRMAVSLFLAVFLILPIFAGYAVAGDVHRPAPVGSYGGIMNPDVSAIINTWALFSDNKENELKDKVTLKEAELAFQSYLYPGVYGNFIVAMHMHDDEWKVHPEEAYVSFLDLPFGFQFHLGRRLVTIGKANAIHPHHWSFATQPLVLENFFGHAWFDDGATIDWLVPNPWDVYFKLTFSALSGATPHHHEEAMEDTLCRKEHVHWEGKTFNFRASTDIPFLDLSNAIIGYSAGWDEGFHTVIHAIDFTLTYRRPNSYKKLRWQSELFVTRTKEDSSVEPYGFYSMLRLTINKYWEFGLRYDESEYFYGRENGSSGGCERKKEFGGHAFLSYYFTHSMYLRFEFRHFVNYRDITENQLIAQLVWGLGPHAHRIED